MRRVDSEPCPYRNRHWPSLDSSIHNLIRHSRIHFPHHVSLRRINPKLCWDWLVEHYGAQCVHVEQNRLVHWTAGRWALINDENKECMIAFERPEEAFEFKMTWG